MRAINGQMVQIRDVVLPVGSRGHVPADTAAVPLMMWLKGRLSDDADIGERCSIITQTGRQVSGFLEDVQLRYIHDFGDYVPELDAVREQLRALLTE